MRAIRGAITAQDNDPAAIVAATGELLAAILEQNALAIDDVVSAIFTMTDDLDAIFPAEAARRFGWSQVPLLCAREITVRGALPRCIRVLLHAESARPRADIRHVYLREAIRLRPDLDDTRSGWPRSSAVASPPAPAKRDPLA